MNQSKHIIVLQHIACEHPGIYRDFMQTQGMTWDAVELDEGESIPSLVDYDAMISMGGPMDVWQEEEHPWLVDEKEAIREAILERRMPFFGVCLGHQLVADALGGEVGPSEVPEVGMLDVHQRSEVSDHALLQGLPETFKTLQWHSAEVKRLPQDATTLMSSPVCGIQALAIGTTVLGIQFHIETTPATIDEWNAIPEYERALRNSFGPDGADKLREQSKIYQDYLADCAAILFRNWSANI